MKTSTVFDLIGLCATILGVIALIATFYFWDQEASHFLFPIGLSLLLVGSTLIWFGEFYKWEKNLDHLSEVFATLASMCGFVCIACFFFAFRDMESDDFDYYGFAAVIALAEGFVFHVCSRPCVELERRQPPPNLTPGCMN